MNLKNFIGLPVFPLMYVTVAVKMTEKYAIDQIPGVKDSLEQTTFDPVFHNLDASFRLTNFTQLKG